MKIYQKLLLILILISLISTGITSFIFLKNQNENILKKQNERKELILSNIKKMAEESEIADDPLMIFDYLKSLAKWQEISEISIKIKNIPWRTIKKMKQKEDILSEIKTKNYQINIYFSKTYFDKELKQEKLKLKQTALWTYFISFIISAILALIISARISNKLKIIETQAEKIGTEEFEENMKLTGHDEIALLSEKLNATGKKIKELDEMKKDFISAATHELRSPLAAIESYINLLINNSKLSAEELKYCENIKRNIKRLSNFITSVLNLSRIEKGEMELNLKDENPFEIVQDSFDFFRQKAKEKEIKFNIEIENKNLILKIDRELLSHVFANLISNAIKFTPNNGEIIVKAFSDNEKFRFEIKDTGPGISKEDIKKLFIPFSRLKKTKNIEGTGLGLAISKKIVDLHKGKIGVISETGKGSLFFVELPL